MAQTFRTLFVNLAIFICVATLSACADSPYMQSVNTNPACSVGRGIDEYNFDYSHCVKDTQFATVDNKKDTSDKETEFLFTWRAGWTTKDLKTIYQYSKDYTIPGSNYFVYREYTDGWRILKGTWRQFYDASKPDNIGAEFNPDSERYIAKGLKRANLPIKVQEAINYSIVRNYSGKGSDLELKSDLSLQAINKTNVAEGLQVNFNKAKLDEIDNAKAKFRHDLASHKTARESDDKALQLQRALAYEQKKATKSEDDRLFNEKMTAVTAAIITTGSVVKQNQTARQQQKTNQRNTQLAAQQAQTNKRNAAYQQDLAQADAQKARDYQQQQTNSNSESQQTVRQTASKRVELATEMQCVKASPTRREGSLQWYNWENHCSYPLNIKWCNTEACTASEWAHYDLQPGGTYESFTSIRNGRYIIRLVNACLTTSNGQEVKLDSNHCWIFN